jgi:hypothetical protein
LDQDESAGALSLEWSLNGRMLATKLAIQASPFRDGERDSSSGVSRMNINGGGNSFRTARMQRNVIYYSLNPITPSRSLHLRIPPVFTGARSCIQDKCVFFGGVASRLTLSFARFMREIAVHYFRSSCLSPRISQRD